MTTCGPKVNLLVSIDAALRDEATALAAAIDEVNLALAAREATTFTPAFQDPASLVDPLVDFPDCHFVIVVLPEFLENVTPVSLIPITAFLRASQKLVRQNSGPPVALFFKRDADRRAAAEEDPSHTVMYLRAQVDLNFTIIVPFPSGTELGQRLATLLPSWAGYSRPPPSAAAPENSVLGGPGAESLFALPAGGLLDRSPAADAEARSRTQELLLQGLLKLLVEKAILSRNDLAVLEAQVAGAIIAEGSEADRAAMLAIASKWIVGLP